LSMYFDISKPIDATRSGTGPKTEDGKRRSRRNAARHGLTARNRRCRSGRYRRLSRSSCFSRILCWQRRGRRRKEGRRGRKGAQRKAPRQSRRASRPFAARGCDVPLG
jgi:hypothetical protein